MADKIQLFGDKDCDCFNRTAERANLLQDALNDLQECGIDCSPLTEENKQTLATATKLKAKFFPDRP